jgi:hypothetical protein
MQKLYCYVDETGQDTEGDLFVVSIILTERERDELEKRLEEIERNSGKGKLKWSRAAPEVRLSYMRLICSEFKGKGVLRFSIYQNTRDYDLATMVAISKALHFDGLEKRYKTFLYVDVLTKSKRKWYGSELRKLGISTGKVQGVAKEISNSAIRLADSIAGWVRDAVEGEQGELSMLFEKASKNKTLIEI